MNEITKEILLDIGKEFTRDLNNFIKKDTNDFGFNDKYNLIYWNDKKIFKEFFNHVNLKSMFFYDEVSQTIFHNLNNIKNIEKVFITKIDEEKEMIIYNNFVNYNFIDNVLSKYIITLKVFRLNLHGVKVSFFKLLEFLIATTNEKYLSENFDSLMKSNILFKHVINLRQNEYLNR